MNSIKYNNCIEQISKKLDVDTHRVKKTLSEKYKNDSIFRIITQINIIKK